MIDERTAKLEEALATLGFVIVPVKGVSMLPMLDEEKDAVKIVPLTGRMKKYDLPLYFRPGDKGLVLHRVVEVKKKYYVTAGDNQRFTERVDDGYVVGVAEGFYKDGKYVSCDDAEYRRYVEERCKNIKKREIIVKEKRLPAEWRALVELVSEAAGGKRKFDSAVRVDFGSIFSLAKNHGVAALISGKIDPAVCPPGIYAAFAEYSARCLQKEILFDAERGAILAEFEKAGIKYLPMKGIILKELYPAKGTREFADNDVLYDATRQSETVEIMKTRGYEVKSLEWVHDTYLREPIYNFELHRQLFANNHKCYAEFADIWSRALPDGKNPHGYRLNDEDLYIYIVSHFYKHYSNGGAGLRSFTDLWLLRKSVGSGVYESEYVRKKLKDMGIDDFERDAVEMTEKIFERDDEIKYDEIAYIIGSGLYGTLKHSVDNAIDKKGKAGYIFSRIFLPYYTMKQMFPWLRYIPILLPLCWGLRLLKPLYNTEARHHMNMEFKFTKNYEKD